MGSHFAPRRRVWQLPPEGFRELRRACLLSRKACAGLLGCSLSTVRAWDRGRNRVPWSVVKILRLYRLGDLGALRPEWHGWWLRGGGLVSPGGAVYALADLGWWSLTCRQAEAFRQAREHARRAEQRLRFSTLLGRIGWTSASALPATASDWKERPGSVDAASVGQSLRGDALPAYTNPGTRPAEPALLLAGHLEPPHGGEGMKLLAAAGAACARHERTSGTAAGLVSSYKQVVSKPPKPNKNAVCSGGAVCAL